MATSRLLVRPATPELWNDVEQLFGEKGACGGCWCMFWRLESAEFKSGKGAGNRLKLRQLVESGDCPGLVGYLNGDAKAWCAVAPRNSYSYLSRSRVLSPVDDQPVWSISCLFVDRAYRRKGYSTKMLVAAVDFARSRGAQIVEGYPVDSGKDRDPDAFVWTGLPGAFRRAGFSEVARRSRTRPIMRYVFSEDGGTRS